MDLNIDKSQGIGRLVLRHLPLIHESGRDVTHTDRHKVFPPSLGLGIISFLFSKHSFKTKCSIPPLLLSRFSWIYDALGMDLEILWSSIIARLCNY